MTEREELVGRIRETERFPQLSSSKVISGRLEMREELRREEMSLLFDDCYVDLGGLRLSV